MKLNILYNNIFKEIDFDENKSLGELINYLLYVYSLLIYNIEYIKINFTENINKESLILEENENIFSLKFNDFISNLNIETNTNIFIIEIIDRKRDFNGNIIKENKFIDNYLKWYEKNENTLFLNNNNNNSIIHIPISSFLNNIFRIPDNILNNEERNIETSEETTIENNIENIDIIIKEEQLIGLKVILT